MTKTISKIGNSQGLIFDAALNELTGLKIGDLVNVEIHQGDKISITPLQMSRLRRTDLKSRRRSRKLRADH